MRFITLLAMLLIGSLAHAGNWDQRFFASYTDQDECCADHSVEDKDDAGLGFLVGYATEGDTFVAGDVYFHNYDPGADIRAGMRGDWGELSAGYGLYNHEINKDRTVQGVVVRDHDKTWADTWFLEYANGPWFARYTYVDAENKMSYSTTISGTTYRETETVETNDQWLWIGYRLDY